MYGNDENGEQGPRGTFEIYRAEGEQLRINGEYKKAIASFTTALELEKGDEECLVSRSRCHLLLGDVESALDDAQACLSENPNFHKGLYQKAEALYFMGEFEQALMFYHRGHRLRPELEEFRLGIQKSREAIINSVGSPEKVKLTKEGDLSYFEELANESKKKPKARGAAKVPHVRSRKEPGPKISMQSLQSDHSLKNLLGELYGDRVYLESLLKDPITTTGPEPIQNLVTEGIKYLDTRTEFWRQQQPAKRPKGPGKPIKDTRQIMTEMNKIERLQNNSKHKECLKKAKRLLESVDDWGPGVHREEIIGNLFSYIGNSFMAQGKADSAIDSFKRDLEIGNLHSLIECKSRALQNLGRAYTSVGQYEDAVASWRSALELTTNAIESSYLYHELGRCLLELGETPEAHKCGKKSLNLSQAVGDLQWQLNAMVLNGQCQIKEKKLSEALQTFRDALILAKRKKDESAKNAISRAISNLELKIKKKKPSSHVTIDTPGAEADDDVKE